MTTEEKFEIDIKGAKIELPSYMLCLNDECINEIIEANESLEKKIIAAGIHPKDGKITFLTANVGLHIFDPSEYYIPEGLYVPMRGGVEVYLPNQEERWPKEIEGFKVSSSWLIESSKSAMSNASLHVSDNYLGEFEFSSIEITGS